MESANPRLLILDDQQAYVRALTRSLPSWFDVAAAHSVAEAQAMIENIDGALVDVNLDPESPEDRSGLDFMRLLREKAPQLPIIAMSALEDEGLPEQTRSAGASLFLPKPIRISELREQLERFFEPPT